VSYKYLISFDFDEDVTHSQCGTDCAEDNEVMYLNTLWIVEFNSSPDAFCVLFIMLSHGLQSDKGVVVVVIVSLLDLQLSVQSVPIISKIVSLNPTLGEVYFM
jgi:hypothetical protein